MIEAPSWYNLEIDDMNNRELSEYLEYLQAQLQGINGEIAQIEAILDNTTQEQENAYTD